jgi:hypothetical protein
MDEDFISKLEWIYDVKCPICGSKASFRITGINKFVSDICGHPEIEKLIYERENQCHLGDEDSSV